MRILKFLFSSILVFAILAAVGFLSAREALLFWGTATVKSSLSKLVSASVNTGQYVRICREKGSPGDQTAIVGMQLRFTSSQEYVLEVICTGFQFDPIIVETTKLPPIVSKVPGAGGVVFGTNLSAVTLSVWGRQQTVGIQDEAVVTSWTAVSTGISPQTTCGGRGYTCCSADSQFGTGQIQTQVTDCPKSCYATCLPRPVVLSFSTDPIADAQTKTVTIGANQTVSFGFVVSYDTKKPLTVVLDYGDGKSETFNTFSGKSDHLYTCNVGICNYTVKLNLQTNDQIDSVDSSLSQFTVRVQP